jgi:hypothetical protein
MVQPTVDEIIEVVTVRHFLMAAAFVIALARHRSAGGGVGDADGDDVFIVMAVVFAVQMAVVQEADMALVLDAGVAAVAAVFVVVVFVNVVRHNLLLWHFESS